MQLSEAEKNYLKCAVLMIAMGIAFAFLDKMKFCIGCIVIGIIFAIIAIYMYVGRMKKDKQENHKEENKEQ